MYNSTLNFLSLPIPTFPESGKEQSLQYVSIAYECGWGATLNHLKNLKLTFLHDFAVGTVALFPPYNSCFRVARTGEISSKSKE